VITQSAHAWSPDDRPTAVIAVVLLGLLALTSLHSYLLFHTLAELAFIIVCVAVIIMAGSLRQFLDDDFALFLGIALVFVAILHTIHLVDYPGLGMISHSLDPPTQLWLGARLLLAATFVVAPFAIGRRVNLRLVAVCYAACDALLLASIFWWHDFPATLTQGGLTPFKRVTEYVVCLLFVIAIVSLRRRRDQLPAQSFRLLSAALVTSIVAELWFSVYHSVPTWPNLVGHLFLVLSAVLFFRAVVDDGLARPHAEAVAGLREAERLHRRLELGLMPTISVKPEGLEVLSLYRPGEQHLALSGDFIDVLDRGEQGVAVICGDVSGHGPNPAALGAMLRASWQALCESGADPLTIVGSLKAVLERERRSPDSFATLCLAWISTARDEIRVLNLGHPVPLLIAAEVEPLDARPTPPLGAIDWPIAEPTVIALPDQWQLFFYTDGLIEGRLRPDSHERYGMERLVESLRALACERIDRTCLESLISSIEAGGGQPFDDDVAVMLISKAEPADLPAAAPASGMRAAIGAGSA
jgi:Membrane-associated sensor domain/Stage II sporulation protein E (SpoIIE)